MVQYLERNLAFTSDCTFIGSSRIDFGQVDEARTFDKQVTAEVDDHGMLKQLLDHLHIKHQ